ncbi:MAG: hypothetical protein R2734_03210 [Nocardioides sp.]
MGGVDPDDTADPALLRKALAKASFVVALELRETDVTRAADVVLPVAPVTDKAGTSSRGGRLRPFGAVFSNPAALPDLRVLAGIAEEMGAPRLPDGRRHPRRVEQLGAWTASGSRRSIRAGSGGGCEGRAGTRHLEADDRPGSHAGRAGGPAGDGPSPGGPARAGVVRRLGRSGGRNRDGRPRLDRSVEVAEDMAADTVWVRRTRRPRRARRPGLAREPGHRERS